MSDLRAQIPAGVLSDLGQARLRLARRNRILLNKKNPRSLQRLVGPGVCGQRST